MRKSGLINKRAGSEVEDLPGKYLEVRNESIEARGFSIELGEPRAHLPKISNKSRVIRQHMAHRIQGIPGRCVELCLFDQVRRDIEGRSHNGRYIKSALEALPVSRAV